MWNTRLHKLYGYACSESNTGHKNESEKTERRAPAFLCSKLKEAAQKFIFSHRIFNIIIDVITRNHRNDRR